MLFVIAATVIVNSAMAQQKEDYQKEWKKVEAFEKKSLTKSAWTAVNNIYKLSQKDNKEAQRSEIPPHGNIQGKISSLSVPG